MLKSYLVTAGKDIYEFHFPTLLSERGWSNLNFLYHHLIASFVNTVTVVLDERRSNVTKHNFKDMKKKDIGRIKKFGEGKEQEEELDNHDQQ